MSNNGRITVILLCHIGLYLLIGELNFLLGNVSLYFHGDALLILFFGLYIGRVGSLLACLLLGFLADSANPVPYGTYIVGYLSIWMFLVWGQKRIRRQNQLHVRTLAAAAQFLWMILLAIVMLSQESLWFFSWSRVAVDILFSTALTFVAAWRWCEIQKQLLYSLGWNLEAQLSKI